MKKIRDYAPSHGIAIVCGLGNFEIPEFPAGQWAASTDECIVVGCRIDIDGPTTFTLGRLDQVATDLPTLFFGRLKAVGGKVQIKDIYMSPILETETEDEDLFVRVWTNDPSEPNQVLIGIGAWIPNRGQR